jgi:hypothetical protein
MARLNATKPTAERGDGDEDDRKANAVWFGNGVALRGLFAACQRAEAK